ncbi:MAG: hypothetical protein WD069_00255 [Planctomycetales bacterium]
MAEPEPERLRRSCVEKLRPAEIGNRFLAILAYLLEEEWTAPRIDALYLSRNGRLRARIGGQVSRKYFPGAVEGLIRDIRGLADVAELGPDEISYLLGRVAGIRRIE